MSCGYRGGGELRGLFSVEIECEGILLMTVEEYNKKRMEFWGSSRATLPGLPLLDNAEVACPSKTCEGELRSMDTAVLTSYPPQRYAVCTKCGQKVKVVA